MNETTQLRFPMPSKSSQRFLYGLVFLSGACGLIYEVVWHRYLAILLGAQARATAVVLAIFLGGISVGYACFGRWSRSKGWNLLTAYSLVEVGMGVWGICFPLLFRLARLLAAQLYGSFGVTSIGVDLLISLLVIGPPTFLMGGTLPLLTQGLSRDFFESSLVHARIYGFNTVGACLGCLLAGYWLIPSSSLGWSTQLAGCLNLLIGATAYFFFARGFQPTPPAEGEVPAKTIRINLSERQAILLGIGFLSGFYLITLQTVIVRLMGLSTGAANYNFTLIVSIFVFCLGVSSLMVREIAQASFNRLFWNQLAVSLTLLALYLSGDYWSYWVHVLRACLRDLPETFFFYQFLLGLGFTTLLVIPIGLSGFTLPLCFHLIKDTKDSLGQRVGQLYAVNTLGCVLGALLGGYWLLNFFNLDQLFKLVVFLSALSAMGAAYLIAPQAARLRVQLFAAGGILTAVLLGTFLAPLYNKNRFIQPFRHPLPIAGVTFEGAEAFGKQLARSTDLLLWKDGPNTSLGVGASTYDGSELSRTIFVNGKSDGNTRGDFFTTVMLAHLPGILQEDLDHVGVIGFGTGTTIGMLAQNPDVKQIDVVEISNTILNNASYFDHYNGGVSTNTKVRRNEMDAFRYFGGTNEKFNVIVSGPSNPWVAGIENLYSQEFYQLARERLEQGGAFIQWIHTYSFNDDLFKLVLRTMSSQFPVVYVFQLKGGDLALIGRDRPYGKQDIARGQERFRTREALRHALEDAGIKNFEAVLALEIVPPTAIKALAGEGPIHTLESPRLSNEASKAFFVGSSAHIHSLRRNYRDYFASLDSSLLPLYQGPAPFSDPVLEGLRGTFCDNPISKNAPLCEETMALSRFQDPKFSVDSRYDEIVTNRELASFDAFHQKIDVKFSNDDLQTAYKMFESYKKYASPLAHIPPERFMSPVDQCLRTVEPDNELYGECMLQKILVLETVPIATFDLGRSVNNFLDWFPKLSKQSPNYARMKEARNILLKLAPAPK